MRSAVPPGSMTLDDDCLLTDPPLEDDGPEAAPGIPTEHAPTRRGRSFQPRAHRHIQPGSSIFKIWLRSQGLPPPPRRPRKEGGGASKSHAHPGPGGQTKGSEGMMPLGEETGFDTGHEPSSSLGGSDVPIAFPHMTHKNEGRQMQLGTGGGSSSGGSVCHPAPPPPPMPPVPPPRNIKHDDPFLPPTPGHPSFSSGSRSSAGTRRHPLPLGANREAPHQPSTLLSSSAPSASCAYRPPDPTSTIPAPSPRRAVPKPPPGPPPPTAASRAPSGPPPGVPPFFHHGRATSPNDPHPFSMEAFHTLPPPPQLPPPGPPDLQWTPTAEGPGMPPFPALPLPPPFSCMGGPFGAPPLPLPPVPLPPPLHSNYAVPTSPTGGRAAEGAPGGASPSPQLGLPEWYHTNVYRGGSASPHQPDVHAHQQQPEATFRISQPSGLYPHTPAAAYESGPNAAFWVPSRRDGDGDGSSDDFCRDVPPPSPLPPQTAGAAPSKNAWEVRPWWTAQGGDGLSKREGGPEKAESAFSVPPRGMESVPKERVEYRKISVGGVAGSTEQKAGGCTITRTDVEMTLGPPDQIVSRGDTQKRERVDTQSDRGGRGDTPDRTSEETLKATTTFQKVSPPSSETGQGKKETPIPDPRSLRLSPPPNLPLPHEEPGRLLRFDVTPPQHQEGDILVAEETEAASHASLSVREAGDPLTGVLLPPSLSQSPPAGSLCESPKDPGGLGGISVEAHHSSPEGKDLPRESGEGGPPREGGGSEGEGAEEPDRSESREGTRSPENTEDREKGSLRTEGGSPEAGRKREEEMKKVEKESDGEEDEEALFFALRLPQAVTRSLPSSLVRAAAAALRDPYLKAVPGDVQKIQAEGVSLTALDASLNHEGLFSIPPADLASAVLSARELHEMSRHSLADSLSLSLSHSHSHHQPQQQLSSHSRMSLDASISPVEQSEEAAEKGEGGGMGNKASEDLSSERWRDRRRSATTPAELEDPDVIWPWTCERCAEVKRRQRHAAPLEDRNRQRARPSAIETTQRTVDFDTPGVALRLPVSVSVPGSARPPPVHAPEKKEETETETPPVGSTTTSPRAIPVIVGSRRHSGGLFSSPVTHPTLSFDIIASPSFEEGGRGDGDQSRGVRKHDAEAAPPAAAAPASSSASAPTHRPPESAAGSASTATAALHRVLPSSFTEEAQRHGNMCWQCAMRKVWMVASLRRRTRDVGVRSGNAGPSGSAPVAVAAPSGGDAAAGTEAAGASVSVSGGNGGTAAEVERLLRAAEPESYED